MFVYDLGILDFFNGMTPLDDYIKLCIENFNPCCYLRIHELRTFLVKCFVHAKSCSDWDGDIREIYISAIPTIEMNTTYKFICFKQNYNGCTYLVSECPMLFNGFPDDLQANEELEKRNLMKWFDQSYTLAESLFNKYYVDKLKESSSKTHVDKLILNEDSNLLKDFEQIG